MGGLRLVFGAVAVLFVVIGLFTSYYTVEPQSQAVIKRFGKVVAVTDPGLHFKLPFGIDRAVSVETARVLKQEFGFRTRRDNRGSQRSRFEQRPNQKDEALMLTGDLNVINVEWVVQYRIKNADLWLHRVRDQVDTVRDVSESVMRQIVGNQLGSEVLTVNRVAIANEARESMQKILDSYELGVHVSAVELQDVTPPKEVEHAFNEVNEARQQKERLVNLAEKERNEVVPRARGEASRILSEAQAYSAERVNKAKGETARFTAVLTEYLKSKEVTRQRLFLEMLDGVLPRIESLYVMDGQSAPPVPLLDLSTTAAGAYVRAAREAAATKQAENEK